MREYSVNLIFNFLKMFINKMDNKIVGFVPQLFIYDNQGG